MMRLDHSIALMVSHADAIRALTLNLTTEQSRWKPDSDSWSALEVINHLYDEEREDFRVRLDNILHRPSAAWAPIDPRGWVTQRAYNQRDLTESVANFLAEREKSVVWLKGLSEPNWQASVESPFGKITAGDMFSAWVMHDVLHIRQLNELHHALIVRDAAPYDPIYAGEW